MAEKMRRHGLLAERAKSLEAQDRELKETIKAAEKRLSEIDASKKEALGSSAHAGEAELS